MPTSTTAAPGFTIAAVTIPGTPTAATTTSARDGLGGEVARAGVADRHRRVAVQEEQRGRLADDVAAADHDRVRALELDAVLVEQREHAERCSRHVRRRAGEQQPGVDGMEAVDVLDRIDGADDAPLVDLAGQRQLDEDPVDRVVRVQLRDEVEQLRLGRLLGQAQVACPRSRPRASPCASSGCRRPTPDRRRRAPSRARSGAGTRPPRPRPRRGSAPRAPSRPSASPSRAPRISSPGEVASQERRRVDPGAARRDPRHRRRRAARARRRGVVARAGVAHRRDRDPRLGRRAARRRARRATSSRSRPGRCARRAGRRRSCSSRSRTPKAGSRPRCRAG